MKTPPRLTFHVVGVTYTPRYPDNLISLRSLADGHVSLTDEPLAAVFVRNPANEYDANAIEVHVPSLGDDAMIGHVPRHIAAWLAPEIDSGSTFQVGVDGVWINPEHPDRPGISVRAERVGA